MQKKARVLVTRLTYGGEERSELGTWTALTAVALATHPMVEEVFHVAIDTCPTPVARHQAIKVAREQACDILISVDGDTIPHRDFATFALPWLMQQKMPAVLAAPYCCGGTQERVQVFRWQTNRNGAGEFGSFENYGREESAMKTGVERVACAGTGCYACHVSAFDLLDPPYFDYEYDSPARIKVICTEDINCFRDLDVAGVPICVTWDHWAIHVKPNFIGKPQVLTPDQVWVRTREMLDCYGEKPANKATEKKKPGRKPKR
jgi:hypothetical protein